ncbi:MAG: hypothetical protein J6N76_09905, partial [Lachnospiraceae bacterium]|nr:hypothetical protein [Lachnospiraceae bacterium]
MAQILGNNKLMEDPAIAAILKEHANLEDILQQHVENLSDTDEIRTVYGHLSAQLETYLNKHAGDKKPIPGIEYVSELYELITEEQIRLNQDINKWSREGKLPDSIETGSDIVERKYIGRAYEGKGCHDLIKTKIGILSLKRENGDEDSKYMTRVKESLRELSTTLRNKIYFEDITEKENKRKDPNFKSSLEVQLMFVRKKYDQLIKACNDYIKEHKNPHSDDGKERKAAVEALLQSVKMSRISVPAAVKSYNKWNNVEGAVGQFEGASFLDAYSMSDKVKRHVIERLVESDRPGVDLNAMALAKRQEELEAEFKRARAEELSTDEAKRKREIENFRRRYKPNMNAREFFVKTGIWRPDAKKDERLKEGEAISPKWEIGKFGASADDLLTGMVDVVTDEEFKAAVEQFNSEINANEEWFSKEENMKLIRDKFCQNLGKFFNTKTKEGKEALYEYNALVSLQYPEVDREIVTFYKSIINLEYASKKDGARSFLNEPFAGGEKFVERLLPIDTLRLRKAKIEKDLSLGKRGTDVYDSPAIKYLITCDSKTEKDYKDNLATLKKQAEGNEKMLKNLVERRFSSLTSSTIYDGLLKFLGEKTLFLSFRQLKTYAENYLAVINITDKDTMRLERDFNEAYAETIKGPFAKYLKADAAEYIRVKPYSKYADEKAKNRKAAIKKDLRMVAVVNEALLNASADAEMTEAGWQRLIELAGKLVRKELKKALNVDEKAHEKEAYNRKGYEWALKDNFEWNKGTEEYLQMDLQRVLRAEVKEQVEKKSAEEIQKRIDEITKKERAEFEKLIGDGSNYPEGEVDRLWATRLKEALDEQFGNEKQNQVFEKNYKEAIDKIPKDRRKEIEKDQKEKS